MLLLFQGMTLSISMVCTRKHCPRYLFAHLSPSIPFWGGYANTVSGCANLKSTLQSIFYSPTEHIIGLDCRQVAIVLVIITSDIIHRSFVSLGMGLTTILLPTDYSSQIIWHESRRWDLFSRFWIIRWKYLRQREWRPWLDHHQLLVINVRGGATHSHMNIAIKINWLIDWTIGCESTVFPRENNDSILQ